MKINNFNNRINLPRFCEKMGYEGLEFQRVPTFGWYAYKPDYSFVGNIFDLTQRKEQEKLFEVITTNHKDCLEYQVAYSPVSAGRLNSHLLTIQLWSAAYSMAKKELETATVSHMGRTVSMKSLLIESGYASLTDNHAGIITEKVLDTFNMLPWPKRKLVNKLLIPTFNTPKHLCSLELADWLKPSELTPVMLNDEKGWYGNINKLRIVGSLQELLSVGGITWDIKADLWTRPEPYELSETLSTNQLLTIWTEANRTTFNVSPLEMIVNTNRVHELKNLINKLSFWQMQEASKIIEEDLTELWYKSRDEQIQVANQTYTKRDNKYFVYKNGTIHNVTNFVIDIEKIVKYGDEFKRHGIIHYEGQTLPFELEEKFFDSSHMLIKGIKKLFLEGGLGIPIIQPDFVGKILTIVDSFNVDAKIENESRVVSNEELIDKLIVPQLNKKELGLE